MNNLQNGNGVWILRIVDTYAFADAGFVNNWTVTFGDDAPTPFVFMSSNLPIIKLNTGGVAIPDEPQINAQMQIIDNGTGNLNYVTDSPNGYSGNITIELRGNFSQILPQKPYKLETVDDSFEELDVPLLGMPAEHDWFLISNYNDKVFMRNALSYDLFTQMGHYATRSRYCEVTLNGSYHGIYLLMETIKRDNDRVDIAKLEPTENTGLDLTGGYILKSDYWNEDDSWTLNYHPLDHPEFDAHLVYDYPKPHDITEPQKEYIQLFINDLETALYSADFADPVIGYNKFLDTDSFIDYFIINELSRNVDGFRKSSYYHKDKDDETAIGKLQAGPVWDFDWAWKNIWGCIQWEVTDGSGWAHHINDCNPDIASNGWYLRLLQDELFANKLRCRWESLRETFLSNSALESYIDERSTFLNDAATRHFERWGNLGTNSGTPELDEDPSTFDGQIEKFKNWINVRLTWLDENIPGTAEGCPMLAVNQNVIETSKITVYPNPASNVVFFKGNERFDLVEIISIEGKMILKNSEITNGINVSGLAPGIYICRFSFEGKNISEVKLSIMY
jgi:hypothetical protein